jgi:hypothetical protein
MCCHENGDLMSCSPSHTGPLPEGDHVLRAMVIASWVLQNLKVKTWAERSLLFRGHKPCQRLGGMFSEPGFIFRSSLQSKIQGQRV